MLESLSPLRRRFSAFLAAFFFEAIVDLVSPSPWLTTKSCHNHSRSANYRFPVTFRPISTSRRIASDRVSGCSLATAQASIKAITFCGMRTGTIGARPPVRGRPLFFGATLIDFFIILVLP